MRTNWTKVVVAKQLTADVVEAKQMRHLKKQVVAELKQAEEKVVANDHCSWKAQPLTTKYSFGA